MLVAPLIAAYVWCALERAFALGPTNAQWTSIGLLVVVIAWCALTTRGVRSLGVKRESADNEGHDQR